MGIYYIIVNDTKREYIDPFYFGDSIRRTGLFKGAHGNGVAQLLIQVEDVPIAKYQMGYWAGDQLRLVGDNFDEEHALIKAEYTNISFYIVANVYEQADADTQHKLLQFIRQNKHYLSQIWAVMQENQHPQLSRALRR